MSPSANTNLLMENILSFFFIYLLFILIFFTLDFSSPVTGMGDNRIINATPPDGIPCISFILLPFSIILLMLLLFLKMKDKEYETNESHAGLLNDLPIVKQIINDLLSQ